MVFGTNVLKCFSSRRLPLKKKEKIQAKQSIRSEKIFPVQ
jgi:hypothetical protein